MTQLSFSFFLVPYIDPLHSNYQFTCVALAQGLQDLKLKFNGNIDYWWDLDTNAWLIEEGDSNSTDVHIYDSKYFEDGAGSVDQVDNDKWNILIDNNDRMFTPALDEKYSCFDLILRTHYLPDYNYRNNVVPWAFGVTKETINAINASAGSDLLPRVMVSYRKLHDIRKMSNERLVPLLAQKFEMFHFESVQPPESITNDPLSLWCQTGRRYDPVYFEELNRSLLNLSFGGTPIVPPLPLTFTSKVIGKIKRTILGLVYGKNKVPADKHVLVQYDSWRLWESFLSPTCPVFTHCDHLGITFPVTPVAGEHYIAIDGFDFEAGAEKILALSTDEIMKIGENGRKWAIDNYAPKPMAQYLIRLLNKLNK